MSGYPPQPPDQQQYNAFLDPAQQEQIQFGALGQPMFPAAKVDDSNRPYSPSAQALAQELHNASLSEPAQQQILPAAQQQQSASIDQTGAEPRLPPHEGASEQPPKTIRLRKACDSCSIRKVKCDESGPPCKACAALEIPCTFDRPSRRRGPPNRHADAIKRRRLEDSSTPFTLGAPVPEASSSPTHAAQALAALSSQAGTRDSAESICPLETLELLIDDFFNYVYPLYPFPHESSFREAWKMREDRINKTFLALLCAMIGALAASVPHRPTLHLSAQRRGVVSSNFTGLVDRCLRLCVSIRGGVYYVEPKSVNIDNVATSFFLALIGLHRQNIAEHQFYIGECLNVLRLLELQRATLATSTDASSRDLGNDDDNVTVEMSRRVFGAVLISLGSARLFINDANLPTKLLPHQLRPYAPLPTEFDDFCIYPTHTESQPEGLLPLTTGFNVMVRVFRSYDTAMTSVSDHHPFIEEKAWKRALVDSARECRDITAGLPPELVLLSGEPSSDDAAAPLGGSFPSSYNQPKFLRDPSEAWVGPPMVHAVTQPHPQERRENQYKAQRAAIFALTLMTRQRLVSKYWSLRHADSTESTGQDAAFDEEMSQIRDEVERDVLLVLGNLDQVNAGPNADFSIACIRWIANELMNQPNKRKGQVTLQSEADMYTFLELLTQLEDPANSDGSADDWTKVKDLQAKIANPSSFFGFS